MSDLKPCIVCGHKDFKLEITVNDHVVTKEDFELHCCSTCGFVFTANAPLETNISKYYESENYISHSDTTKKFEDKIYYLVRQIMLSRKYQLIKKLDAGKDIIDIGCGTGYFLNYMKHKHYKTFGVEVSKKVREYAKAKFQLDIRSPEDFLNGALKTKVSFISLWHVLEHLYNPERYLQVIRTLLKDDGYLIIALPNLTCFDANYYKSFWAGYDAPRHLWHFSPDTIATFAQNHGFKTIKMKRLPFDAFHNSMLSEKFRGNKLPIFKMGLIGSIATIKSWIDIRHTSSIIYVMQKETAL